MTHACGSGAAGAEQTAPHFVAGCKRVWLAKLFTTRNKVLWGLFSLLLRSELQTGADGEQGMDGVSLDKGKIPTTSLKKKNKPKKCIPLYRREPKSLRSHENHSNRRAWPVPVRPRVRRSPAAPRAPGRLLARYRSAFSWMAFQREMSHWSGGVGAEMPMQPE